MTDKPVTVQGIVIAAENGQLTITLVNNDLMKLMNEGAFLHPVLIRMKPDDSAPKWDDDGAARRMIEDRIDQIGNGESVNEYQAHENYGAIQALHWCLKKFTDWPKPRKP
jgi:hypothetical protein